MRCQPGKVRDSSTLVAPNSEKMGGLKINAHLTTVLVSFGRSPKLGKYCLTITPDLSFFFRRSHLFRNRIMVAFERSADEVTDRHSMKESSSLLTFESSDKRSSKHDTANDGDGIC